MLLLRNKIWSYLGLGAKHKNIKGTLLSPTIKVQENNAPFPCFSQFWPIGIGLDMVIFSFGTQSKNQDFLLCFQNQNMAISSPMNQN